MSMKKIAFQKYHCLGNDFIILDLIGKRSSSIDHGIMSESICRRNSGVGADGILVLSRSKRADCFLDIYNSDGSWAEKSGNGLRIAAAYVFSKYKSGRKVLIETKQDLSVAQIIKSGSKYLTVKVSLGRPRFETKYIPMSSKRKFHVNLPIKIGGFEFVLTALSVGNPHAVIFVEDFDFDWKFLGFMIENHHLFPNRTNVEFVRILSRSGIQLNDWERGAGATGSSGTGAAASVVAGIINGFLNREVIVHFPLGSLTIEWSANDKDIFLTGPVEFICRGEFLPD
jgi:diaminopimelate epimerase